MKRILHHTRAVLEKKEKRKLMGLVILDILISIMDILSLALLLWIIRFYIQPQPDPSVSFLPGWLADQNSIAMIAVFLVFFGLKNFAAYLTSRAHYRFMGEVALRVTRNNLMNYQQSGYEEFVQVDSSSHIRKISFQPFEFTQHVLSGTQQIITQGSLILIAIAAILLFDARLFLLLFCILLPPVVAVFYFIKNRLGKIKKQIIVSNEKSFQHLLDALKGYVESNVYGRHEFFLKRYLRHRKSFSTHMFESVILQGLPARIIEVFAVAGLFILIAIAQWSGNTDSATLITIGAFMAAAYKIIPGIVKIINLTGQIRTYELSIGGLTHPQPGNVEKIKLLADRIHSIRFEKVNFTYSSKPLLNGVTLSIQKGDFLGISGASGKGKTTLINLLLGFLTPSAGEILFNEKPTTAQNIKEFWPSIAYTRQQPFLIHDTIFRNITLDEGEPDKERLYHALSISGLNELINQSPEGLDKIIAENGKNISGGQQQRVCLARALYKNADLVLLDEPFNELDEPSTIKLLEYFSEMARNGKMIVLITHDSKSLSYCNKVISLDER